MKDAFGPVTNAPLTLALAERFGWGTGVPLVALAVARRVVGSGKGGGPAAPAWPRREPARSDERQLVSD
jgi:hypothetical protein